MLMLDVLEPELVDEMEPERDDLREQVLSGEEREKE